MNQKTILLLAIALLLGLLVTNAKADFLGLAPGDYTVTLGGSSALCGGSNCVGTVHIPVGTVTTANFDWNFVIAGVTFDFTAPVDVSLSPNGLNSCAVEATTSADCTALDNGGFNLSTNGDVLFMTNLSDHRYDLFLPSQGGQGVTNTWAGTAIAAVPEPSGITLLGLALGLLALRRKVN